MSERASESEKKRKKPVVAIDITLNCGEDDNNCVFSASNISQNDDAHAVSSTERPRPENICELREPDNESRSSLEKRYVEAQFEEDSSSDDEDPCESDINDVEPKPKRKRGRPRKPIRDESRLDPALVIQAQAAYVEHNSGDGTFQVMYTPLNIESSHKDASGSASPEYSIGFITVDVKEVSENQFLSLLYESTGVESAPDSEFSSAELHCCRPSRSICDVWSRLLGSGVSPETVEGIVQRARRMALPTSERGEKSLLFVAMRMPAHVMRAVQSPVLSFNLRVRVVREHLIGGRSLLPAASRFCGLGSLPEHEDMKPLVLTSDEVHRHTMRYHAHKPPRCIENLPTFHNTAFVLECVRLSPIVIGTPSPHAELSALTVAWCEKDPATVDAFVDSPQQAQQKAVELSEMERAKMALSTSAPDTSSKSTSRASWPPPRFTAAQTIGCLIVPQRVCNVTTRKPSTIRRPSWQQAPIDRFDRSTLSLFYRSPLIVIGPCFINDGSKVNASMIVRRAIGRFEQNLQLRHVKTVPVSQRIKIDSQCVDATRRDINLVVWLDMLRETDQKHLKPAFDCWISTPRGRNEQEVRFWAVFNLVEQKQAYLDASGWPTDRMVRHFSFASSALMGVDFWLVAVILSLDTAMVCVLRGVLESVYGMLTSRLPHDVLLAPTLSASGIRLGPNPADRTVDGVAPAQIENFIRGRVTMHEIKSLTLFSYAITVQRTAPWSWSLALALERDDSDVSAHRKLLETARLVGLLLDDDSATHVDGHTALVSNHLIRDADIPLLKDCGVRATRLDAAFDMTTATGTTFATVALQTEQCDRCVLALTTLLTPCNGPFAEQGIEVVRCQTRSEHGPEKVPPAEIAVAAVAPVAARAANRKENPEAVAAPGAARKSKKRDAPSVDVADEEPADKEEELRNQAPHNAGGDDKVARLERELAIAKMEAAAEKAAAEAAVAAAAREAAVVREAAAAREAVVAREAAAAREAVVAREAAAAAREAAAAAREAAEAAPRATVEAAEVAPRAAMGAGPCEMAPRAAVEARGGAARGSTENDDDVGRTRCAFGEGQSQEPSEAQDVSPGWSVRAREGSVDPRCRSATAPGGKGRCRGSLPNDHLTLPLGE
jgi:hypothetical protein